MDWIIPLAHWFGSAVCDQLHDNSYVIGGFQLPLCARCTGMYLGALATLIFHSWRHPGASTLPRSWVITALPLFFFAWAGDGVNSLLSSIPGLPHLYPPQNLFRLVTGSLMGISVGSLIYIVFNSVMWRPAKVAAILTTPSELLALIGLCGLIVVAVLSNWSYLLYPLTVLSLIAIIILNSTLMSALAASLLRKPAQTWREARIPFVGGTAIALILLNSLALFRVALGAWLGVQI